MSVLRQKAERSTKRVYLKKKQTKSSLHIFFLFNSLNILLGKGDGSYWLRVREVCYIWPQWPLKFISVTTEHMALFAWPTEGCEIRHPNSPSGTVATSLPWSELSSVDRDPDMQISTQKHAFCHFLSSNFLLLPSSGEEIHHWGLEVTVQIGANCYLGSQKGGWREFQNSLIALKKAWTVKLLVLVGTTLLI